MRQFATRAQLWLKPLLTSICKVWRDIRRWLMISVYATGEETQILDCGSVGRRRSIDCVPKGAIEGTMLIPIGQSVAKRCTGYRRFVHGHKGLLIGVYKNVGLGVRIPDEVIEASSVEGQRVELLDRNAAFVFDDTLQAPVDVSPAEDDTAA